MIRIQGSSNNDMHFNQLDMLKESPLASALQII